MKRANDFIVAEFRKRRKVNPNFTLRSYAKWIGLSAAQVSQMMSGKRPVSLASLRKVLSKAGLSPFEQESLLLDVLGEDSALKKDSEKPRRQLAEDQFRLIADWYHLAILALCETKGAKSDSRWISRKLEIPLETTNLAIQRLERLGILQMKPRMKQLCEPFEVLSETPSEAIRKYHKQNLQLAIDKTDSIPQALREFQSISFAMGHRQIPKFKKLIDRFLDQASALAKTETGEDVFHLNVQLFPVTKIEESKNEK